MAQTFNVVLHVPRLNREEVKSVLGQVGAFAGSDVSVFGAWVLQRGAIGGSPLREAGSSMQGPSRLCRCGAWHPLTAVRAPSPRPQLEVAAQELEDGAMPIKRLLLLLDLARQGLEEGERAVPISRWTQVIQDLGIA